MASYAAVKSLQQTIERLLNSATISILPASQEILKFAYNQARSLQLYLNRLGSSGGERINGMNVQIREEASKLEDAILSHVSDQFLSQTEDQINIGANQILCVDLDEVKQELCSFTETAKRIMEENKIEDLLAEEEDDISLTSDFGGKYSKMVGFSDLFSKIKNTLTHSLWKYRNIVSLVGMAGIGKTTLAMKSFEDPEILSHFEHRAFVAIGPKYELREVMLGILAQLTCEVDEIHKKGVEEVGKYLFKTLSDKRYLIVLDDVWDRFVYDKLAKYLPHDSNQSRILLTTRSLDVVYGPMHLTYYHMPFLNKEESWDLLRERVFGEESLCPIQLEKYGKKIAENCEGLPLTIIAVASILSKNDKTPEYWKQTMEKKNSIFRDAYDQMFPILFPSYKYLYQYLKPFFLYLGVFPPSWKINASKIVKLLSAEGFLERYHPSKDSEDYAMGHLEMLVSKSLALIHQQSSRFGAKTLSLHSANWHMCNRVARTEKVFHVISSYPDSISMEDMVSQQRLCIHNNVLFGIKEVYNSMEFISTVRSLLCTGSPHQYPVRICFGLRFLRVLDALTIRFYKFPNEVLKLVQLRYLALTCNVNVPASISKLWSLEYLFVRRHLIIKPSVAWPCLPMEIWNMKELRHLQVMGSKLPYHCGAMLPNLLTLTDMSADRCTAEILRGTPNLKKLGIQIEIPLDGAEPLRFFDHLYHLHKLKSLKCIVVNPKPRSRIVAPLRAFPSRLRKLNLIGCGYPWEYMNTIAQMSYLEVLKVKCYAFQGSKWETKRGFINLKFLLIEETDLVHWVANGARFLQLKRLIVRHCYKLKGIPSGIGDCNFLEMIELVDCPSAENSVKQIQKRQMDLGNDILKVCIQSSWNDRELES